MPAGGLFYEGGGRMITDDEIRQLRAQIGRANGQVVVQAELAARLAQAAERGEFLLGQVNDLDMACREQRKQLGRLKRQVLAVIYLLAEGFEQVGGPSEYAGAYGLYKAGLDRNQAVPPLNMRVFRLAWELREELRKRVG
jgi:hypothetical protein